MKYHVTIEPQAPNNPNHVELFKADDLSAGEDDSKYLNTGLSVLCPCPN